MSISTTDPGGQKRGNEDDISYTPAGRAKLMAEIPPTGPFGQPDKTTDPWVRYCEPNGPVRIYAHPARTIFRPPRKCTSSNATSGSTQTSSVMRC